MFDILQRDADGKPTHIRMSKPDDWHEHVREDDMLKLVAPMVARRFHLAIVMPNLKPPITTVKMAQNYRSQIIRATAQSEFHPVMTFYLTDSLEPREVEVGLRHSVIRAIKYYPRGLTTNSDAGVKDPSALWTPGTKPYECLEVLVAHKGILLLHAADGFDAQGNELDPYDQERHFIEHTLPKIMGAHPGLKISVEHISTSWGVGFMLAHGGERLGCSITAHHLLLDRRDVFRGGFRPHRSWMPVIQSAEHRDALRTLATADKSFVWLGSDSAPHPKAAKESDCCASGVLMAHAGIELYVEAFEEMGALDGRFERFACQNGRQFFGFKEERRVRKPLELMREEWVVQPFFFGQYMPAGNYTPVVPFRLGEKIQWKLVD